MDCGLSVAVRRRADGSALPVVAAPGGRRYVVSEEGAEWDVLVRCEDRFQLPSSSMLGAAGFVLGVDLRVDGQKVGYWYTIGPDGPLFHEQARFDGFCESVGGMTGGGAYQTTYRRFKFARADAGADEGPEVFDPEQIKAGRIEVNLSWYAETGHRHGPPNPGTDPTGGAALGHLPDGKKFFLAPSLKTDRGRAEAADVRWNAKTYAMMQHVTTIELRYETASTLLLRKTLDSANPAHRQLLRTSRDPTVRALLGDSDDDEEEGQEEEEGEAAGGAAARRRGGAASGSGGSRPRVKRERGGDAPGAPRVKREGGGVGTGTSGGGFVDLTKPTDAPLVVDGRVVGGDEIAVCDLLDSDDEGAEGGGAARWEVRKRQAVELEGADAAGGGTAERVAVAPPPRAAAGGDGAEDAA